MGNQLGIAPSQIYPVDHYFSGQFGNAYTYEKNMGSTRFFKVALAKSEEGLVVIKVFVKNDPTLPLEEHKEKVQSIKKSLQNAVNCLPFQRVELTERAAYVLRQFVKQSLYDRVSTRPFLTVLEKKWITFQILCALNQCHKQKICHGDIKLENILITSWNWILLSDFASFKPTYLPEDNPADYTYFFDTSRRRTCYIAPERFVKTMSSEETPGDTPLMGSMLPTDSLVRLGSHYMGNQLLPAMDIFSAGCALLELWTEGKAPFELSQLLAYRRGDRTLVEKHLDSIENERLKSLLSSMLDLTPMNRKSAEDYLDQERGQLFPEYFYSFLQSYLQMFSSLPIMTEDDKILRLYSDIDHCIKVLTTKEGSEDKDEGEKCKNSDEDGLILIITVVTSTIRGLHHCNTKICCLEILQKLSEYTISETILDRILPYILYFAQDSSPRVQAKAIETLTACLGMVKNIPRSDAHVFPEYILPAIAGLATDPSTNVRVSYARNIAQLAKSAVFFLEETQLNSPNEMPARRYEAELNALHEIIQQTVLSLLTDSQTIVKQTLIESGICDLCSFFGKQKANDIILSHMITFLNDKDDKNLRGSFFDCIVGVVGYVGWQCSEILIPLLQQGFTDSEEFVIVKAIRATSALIDLGHITKPMITEFISEVACYLIHPNLWIRHEISGLISTTARKLSPIDVQCKIMPSITKFLKSQLIQLERAEILLDCLQPPVPRGIFDSVVKFPDILRFLQILEDREVTRKTGEFQLNDEIGQNLKNFFRRLYSEGMTEAVERQLLYMKQFLLKLNKYKNQDIQSSPNGRIVLNKRHVFAHQIPLFDKPSKPDGKRVRSQNSESNTNLEWQHIHGHIPVASSPSNDSHNSATIAGSPPAGSVPQQAASSLVEYSMPDRNFWQERTSECKANLENLTQKMKTQYTALAKSQFLPIEKYQGIFPSGWGMNGSLVAHLHEHSESVIKLASVKPNGSIFASGSLDGTVRLWDCNKLNGNHSVNKSRQVYVAQTPIHAVTACDAGQGLAVGGSDGSLLIMRIDRNSSKMTLQQALRMDDGKIDDGPIVDMQSFDQSQNLFLYATLYGAIVAWDIRMQVPAWKVQNELKHGVITSLCADPTGSWLATGTSGGKHICWDLRFKLPMPEIRHPTDSLVRKIICHPTEPSYLISSFQTNNEVSIWNMEYGQRETVLWGSDAPPLSNMSKKIPIQSCGLLAGVVDNNPFILTGSSDHRIRFWDLSNPKNTRLVVPNSKDNLSNVTFSYENRLIDGINVIKENIVPTNSVDTLTSMRSSSDETPRSGPDMPSTSHKDAITDLLVCKTDKLQTFVVSSARDGVIKVWK